MKKFPLFILFLSASCIAPRVSITNTNATNNLVIDGKTFATAYQQRAAEYKALCYQAFNLAHLKIEQFNRERSPKPKAIMTDIDETILNNSPYQAHQLLQGKDYDASLWKEWTAKGEADTIPGALHFLQFASAAGIEIFYVTNREEDERDGTLKNLKKFNFPNADNEHLLLKGNTSSKEARKNSIAETHSI
ncbi:MAG: 5'-nucleotidase, lipoprotein e(P4) family, partial [Ginsengibacter sp.]